jgi:hypothetical protein
MGRVIRIKVNWTGFIGSPGYTNLHFEPTVEGDPITQTLVDAAVSKVQTWLSAMRPALPTVVTTVVDGQVAEIDEQTGNIEAFWTATPAAAAPGTATGNYSSGVGLCINWSTAGVRNNRRVRGRTFVVPLASSAFSADGSFNDTNLAAWRGLATTLAADSNGVRLVVMARTPGAIIPDGGAYDVTTASINDRPAFLSSRRD